MAIPEKMSWSSVHDFETGEVLLRFVAPIENYPDWEVTFVVLVTSGGTAGLADLRIHPSGFNEEDEYPSTAEVPSGGISARLIRSIRPGKLLAKAQQIASAEAPKSAKRVAPSPDVVINAIARIGNAERRRPGRKGNGVEHYLDWAVLYNDKVQAGSRKPIVDLARQTNWSVTTVRDTIANARSKYGLLTSSGQGRAGGELTPVARRLLAERKSAKEEVANGEPSYVW